tara:strand:- start:521 stop:1102 length:582 start_codon:yes stop_codon:yes gene_type:complete
MLPKKQLFILITISSVFGQSEIWYQKFLSSLYNDSGVRFTAQITQKELEFSTESKANIEIIDSSHIIFDLDQETIFISGDTIQTYNKLTNQLIIDRIINNDFGLLSLLTGNLKDISFNKSILSKNRVKIIYSIPDFSYDGYIDILKSGEPKKMNIVYAKNQFIDIKITNFKVGGLKIDTAFRYRSKEIINLYE